MADEKPPMTFGNVPPQVDAAEQFARMPISPEQQLKDGGRPEKWSPGLGVGTAPPNRGKIPWPPAKAPPTPFRNLSSGRK
jgi:hypothetical protein